MTGSFFVGQWTTQLCMQYQDIDSILQKIHAFLLCLINFADGANFVLF